MVEAGLDAVREWEAEHGALTSEELATADGVLGRLVENPEICSSSESRRSSDPR